MNEPVEKVVVYIIVDRNAEDIGNIYEVTCTGFYVTVINKHVSSLIALEVS